MSTYPPPLSIPSSNPSSDLRFQAEHWGRKLGTWTAQLRRQRYQAKYAINTAQNLWRRLQTQEGRKRNLGWMLGAVAATGLVIGLALRRRGY